MELPTTLPPIPHASTNEKLIVGKLVTDILAAGFPISVNDGEEITVSESTDPAAIFPALCSTDEDILYVHKPNGMHPFIKLVWGNDCDVISDYAVSLEPLIKGAEKLANELEASQ